MCPLSGSQCSKATPKRQLKHRGGDGHSGDHGWNPEISSSQRVSQQCDGCNQGDDRGEDLSDLDAPPDLKQVESRSQKSEVACRVGAHAPWTRSGKRSEIPADEKIVESRPPDTRRVLEECDPTNSGYQGGHCHDYPGRPAAPVGDNTETGRADAKSRVGLHRHVSGGYPGHDVGAKPPDDHQNRHPRDEGDPAEQFG